MPTAGPTLRIDRLRAHLTATALAAQMGLSRQALWALERAAKVSPERVTLYRESVKTLRDAKDEAA